MYLKVGIKLLELDLEDLTQQHLRITCNGIIQQGYQLLLLLLLHHFLTTTITITSTIKLFLFLGIIMINTIP